MGGGDTPEVGHILDGPDGEAAVDEAVVHEHVGHSEQRDPQPLRATQRRGTSDTLGQREEPADGPSVHVPWFGCHRTRQQKQTPRGVAYSRT